VGPPDSYPMRRYQIATISSMARMPPLAWIVQQSDGELSSPHGIALCSVYIRYLKHRRHRRHLGLEAPIPCNRCCGYRIATISPRRDKRARLVMRNAAPTERS
jgi:hypothetical protein